MFHKSTFCNVHHPIPDLWALSTQLIHHPIECINRTEYTVGTVGIPDIFCSMPGTSRCPPASRRAWVSLVCAQPSSAHRGLRGLFSSASKSHCVVSAFPRGSRTLPCDHAEILYALANGLLWKLINGFRHTLSQGPPQPLLGLASLMVEWAGAKQLCPWMPQHPPDTVIPPRPSPPDSPPLWGVSKLYKSSFSALLPLWVPCDVVYKQVKCWLPMDQTFLVFDAGFCFLKLILRYSMVLSTFLM